MKINDFNKLKLSDRIAHIQSLTIGSIHTVVYSKKISLSPEKFAGAEIVKVSTIQGRFGLEYGDNLSMVKEAHENGMGYGKLYGFKAVIDNLLYENEKTGAKAFRFFPFSGSMHKSVYYLNGNETTLEDLLAQGYPKSKLVSNGNPPVLALYADNIVSIA